MLGAEWHLYRYDATGRQVWSTRIPEVAWEVDLSDDGELAVATLGDGTIRWYRTADGFELLTLFPMNDGRRWILWTPHGYYDCAPGAENLIGWQVNSRDGADFYPASRLRATFYRPEVVARMLETRDELAALGKPAATSLNLAKELAGAAEVAKKLPPIVEIISPTYGAFVNTTDVLVRFRIRTAPDAPVTSVFALVNGRPPLTNRGVGVRQMGDDGATVRELTVPIPPADSEITIIAENRNGASPPQSVPVRWAGFGKPLPGQHRLYVLAVGISNYSAEGLKLPMAAKDASDVATLFEGQRRSILYSDVVVRLLTDQAATREGILSGFDWLRNQAGSGDVAIIFLSGHGDNDSAGQFLFVPYDVNLQDLLHSCVTSQNVQSVMKTLAARPIVFIDACHSGSIMRRWGGGTDVNGFANELESAETGAVVITAATGKQNALENRAWNNGAFTKALLEALHGDADYFHEGRVTVNGLLLYVTRRVTALTRSAQTPAFAMPETIADFPLTTIGR
jgi:hypothetical protein